MDKTKSFFFPGLRLAYVLLRQGDRPQRRINLPKTALKPEVTFEWKIPQWTNAIERDRARTYFQAYAAAAALHFIEKALADVRAGQTKTWEPFEVPDEGIGCGFTEAVRGVLSHHMVIRAARSPTTTRTRRRRGTPTRATSTARPGPYEDAVKDTPIFEENTATSSRASTSCGPCAASTRACRAACTCTSARASAEEGALAPTLNHGRPGDDDRARRAGPKR